MIVLSTFSDFESETVIVQRMPTNQSGSESLLHLFFSFFVFLCCAVPTMFTDHRPFPLTKKTEEEIESRSIPRRQNPFNTSVYLLHPLTPICAYGDVLSSSSPFLPSRVVVQVESPFD